MTGGLLPSPPGQCFCLFYRGRSVSRIVHSRVNVKCWSSSTPSVGSVRPGKCVRCGVAGHPVGVGVVIQGHGLRERQILGPVTVGGAPRWLLLSVRRYRCTCCRAVMLVIPREMAARRLYSRAAIALALALFAEGVPIATIREQTSPWQPAGPYVATRWTSLFRWLSAASAGLLFNGIRGSPGLRPLRRQACVVADQLIGRSPSDSLFDPPQWRAFRGIEHGI